MIKGIPKHILDLCVIRKPHAYDHPDDYKITGLKPQTGPCPDCDRTVTDRVVYIRMSTQYGAASHWRSMCQSCKMYKNPKTGCFDIKPQEAQLFFRNLYYKKK